MQNSARKHVYGKNYFEMSKFLAFIQAYVSIKFWQIENFYLQDGSKEAANF